MTPLTLIIKRFNHIIGYLRPAFIMFTLTDEKEYIYVFYMSKNEIFGPN